MDLDIKSKIYQAQCIGNVEPIEYMIPYPSMRSLIEGQNIKYATQIIIKDRNITNQTFYNYVQQTSHWLESLGLEPKERMIIPDLGYPQTEILLYGIWNLGAIGVLAANADRKGLKSICRFKLDIDTKTNLFEKIKGQPIEYKPKYKPLLDDEALLSFEQEDGIRLSHYNLLVNTNGIQKAIGLKSRTKIFCDLKPRSATWVIFQAILPIYCGCIFDHSNPEVTFGNSKNSFNLRADIKNIAEFAKDDIGLCPENTAAISIGSEPIHLTSYSLEKTKMMIKGHSVMMGYLNELKNESSYYKEGLHISI